MAMKLGMGRDEKGNAALAQQDHRGRVFRRCPTRIEPIADAGAWEVEESLS